MTVVHRVNAKIFWPAAIATLLILAGGLFSSCGFGAGEHRVDDDTSPDDDDNDDASALWTDATSGLTWQNGATVGAVAYDWQAAAGYCAGLNWGGLTGWRLPTISELRSLIRGCAGTITGGSCGVTDDCLSSQACWNALCYGCSESGGSGSGGAYWPPEISGEAGAHAYWSSSSLADYGYLAWSVDFSAAGVDAVGVVSDLGARCVR